MKKNSTLKWTFVYTNFGNFSRSEKYFFFELAAVNRALENSSLVKMNSLAFSCILNIFQNSTLVGALVSVALCIKILHFWVLAYCFVNKSSLSRKSWTFIVIGVDFWRLQSLKLPIIIFFFLDFFWRGPQ